MRRDAVWSLAALVLSAGLLSAGLSHAIIPGQDRWSGNDRRTSLAAGCVLQPPDPSRPASRRMLCPGHAGWRIERVSFRDGDAFALIAADGRRVPLDVETVVGGRVRLGQPWVDWSALGFHAAPPSRSPVLALHLEQRMGATWQAVAIIVRLEGAEAPCIVNIVPAGAEMAARIRDALFEGSRRACLTSRP